MSPIMRPIMSPIMRPIMLPRDVIRYILGFIDEVPIDIRLEFGMPSKPVRLPTMCPKRMGRIHHEFYTDDRVITYLTVGTFSDYRVLILSDKTIVTTWSSGRRRYNVFQREECDTVYNTKRYNYYVPTYVLTSP